MNAPLQPGDWVIRATGPLQEEIDGALVIADVDSGNYFGLDAIGTEIWNALEQRTQVGALCDRLAAGFNAPAETVRNDVLAFLEHLREHHLIVPA